MKTKVAIGLMSGTSMDGIDVSLLITDGMHYVEEQIADSIKYSNQYIMLLKAAEYSVRKSFGNLLIAHENFHIDLEFYLSHELNLGDLASKELLIKLKNYLKIKQNELITLQSIVQKSTYLHFQAVSRILDKSGLSPRDIDVIGYHGQTLYHNPAAKCSIQIGDGELLANLSGINVVSNFRQNDLAHGGQGAPFAPIYHQVLAIKEQLMPSAIVNCGGISNITLVLGDSYDDLLGFDVGPGNGLIDKLVRYRTNGQEIMDVDGKYGLSGRVCHTTLAQLQKYSCIIEEQNFYELSPPKSLDIGDLSLVPALRELKLEDACATLEAFSAKIIVDSVVKLNLKQDIKYWLVAGGGWHNPVIFSYFEYYLKQAFTNQPIIKKISDLGWNLDSLEAQLFAFLAVRSLKDYPLSIPTTTNVEFAVSGGELHKPDINKFSS